MVDQQINRRAICRAAGTPRSAALLPLLALFLLVSGCGKSDQASGPDAKPNGKNANTTLETETIQIKGQTFELELALDNESRKQGLSDRKEIAEDGGMLFVFTQLVPGQFVMRRCYVPIDLIYLDDDGYIDSMHHMQVIEPIGGAQWNNPSRPYLSSGYIQYVIELKGGSIDKLDLKTGEKIDLPFESLQDRAQ